jgi:hypothetical protein
MFNKNKVDYKQALHKKTTNKTTTTKLMKKQGVGRKILITGTRNPVTEINSLEKQNLCITDLRFSNFDHEVFYLLGCNVAQFEGRPSGESSTRRLLLPISCVACCPTLKIEVMCSSETSDSLRTIRRYNPEGRNLQTLY